MEEILKIEDLRVSFDVYAGQVHAVRGVSLQLGAGETLALVGESGCGKSVTAQAVLGLNPSPPARVENGRILLCGIDVTAADARALEQVRGRLAGMVFQNPMTSLNPTMRIGRQLTEQLRRRKRLSTAECAQEAVRMLESVQISQPALRARQYPHQLSGGMRQRVMLAMALAEHPRLLIADEPTTALDVTIQLEILRLLKQLGGQTGMGILLITHDLGVVAGLADRVAVMYAGQIVEESGVRELFFAPAHPYTRGLLQSMPGPGQKGLLHTIPGAPPDLFTPPEGCGFAPRCAQCMRICRKQAPPVFSCGDGHGAACWLLHPDYVGEGARI